MPRLSDARRRCVCLIAQRGAITLSTECLDKLQRRWHRQSCARVVGTGPGEFLRKSFAEKIGNHHRMQVALAFRCCNDKATRLWRAQPFMAIANVPIHTQLTKRIQRQRQHPRCMRAIHQHLYAAFMAYPHDSLEGGDHRQWRENVIDDRDARTGRECIRVSIDECLRPGQRPRYFSFHYGEAMPLGKKAHRILHRRIRMICEHDTVTRLPSHRAQYGIDACRGIFHKSQR